MYSVKLQAVKDRLNMNIKSGHVMINTKDRDWLIALIENLIAEVESSKN